MVYPWKVQGENSQGVIAFLEIDNRRCTTSPGAECFSTASEVYIMAFFIFTTSDVQNLNILCKCL